MDKSKIILSHCKPEYIRDTKSKKKLISFEASLIQLSECDKKKILWKERTFLTDPLLLNNIVFFVENKDSELRKSINF